MIRSSNSSDPDRVAMGASRPSQRTPWARWRRRLGMALAACLVMILLLPLAGLIYQKFASARDAHRYPPPGKLFDVGGHRLHMDAQGESTPTVVLDSGVCDCSVNWHLVQGEVAKFARVCAYDRAGMGWSEMGPLPRVSSRIVQELHTLLNQAGIAPPYVLVGHSFGGYNVRLFAHQYPQEVAGLVLVDAAHEDQWPKLPASVMALYGGWKQQMYDGRPLSKFGVNRLFFTYPNPKLPAALQPLDQALRSRTSYLATLASEWENIMDASAQEVRATAIPPSLPLMILTAGQHGPSPPPGLSTEDFQEWNRVLREMQSQLALRSSNCVQIVVSNSTHVMQLDQPAVVVDAIREVVSAVREQRPLRQSSVQH